MSAATQGWLIIIFSLLIGFSAVFFILTWMRSHRLEIRDPLNRNNYINRYWVSEKVDKETGVMFWKCVMRNMKVPEPPKDAIDVGKRGRKFASCYKLSEDEFVWITDNGIKVREIDGKLKAVDIADDGTEKTIDSFKPFTPVQRQVLINQYTKANDISKKKWTPMDIIGVVSMGSIVFIIALMLLFGGDLLKEYRETRAETSHVLKQASEITKSQAMLMAAMGVKVENMEVILAQTVEQQQGTPVTKPDDAQTFDVRSTVGLT